MSLLGGIVLTILCFGGSRTDSVILLPENTRLSAERSPLTDEWIPLSCAWYWRTKEFVFGKRKTVAIHAAFIHIEPAYKIGALISPAAVKSIRNLHVYFVSTNDVAERRNRLASGKSRSSEFAAGIITSHGTRAKVVMGGPQSPWLSLEVIAKRRGSQTDLLTSVQATGLGAPDPIAMRDLKFVARLQVPKDHAALILRSDPNDPVLVGVVLTPQWK